MIDTYRDWLGAKSIPAMNQERLMSSADSKMFSVTTSILPSSVLEDPTTTDSARRQSEGASPSRHRRSLCSRSRLDRLQ